MINIVMDAYYLRPRRPPCEYLGKYISRGKLKIPPVDRIPVDPSHKAMKDPLTMPTWTFKP